MGHPEAKIKIVFVITGTGVGGAEKVLYHTSRFLDFSRYVPSVCSLKEKGAMARQLEDAGIEVHSLAMADGDGFAGWLASLQALFRLAGYLLQARPTIVHSFLFRANILSRIAACLARVPLVISSVRVMGGEKNCYHTVERLTSFMVDHYITVSERVKEHLIRMAGVPAGKITTIYNGVSPDECCPRHPPGSEGLPYGLKAHHRVLLAVGRLHRQKGYDVLMRAFAAVQKEYPTLKLLIIGEGEDENHLKNLAKSLDLTEQVIFTGMLKDSGRILRRAEVFILPSLWEGMPNALLEAMAAGIPVVATEVGGVPELVLQGATGILVPPGDADALARAITDLCGDPAKARSMGEAGRKRVEEHFSLAAMLDATERLYRELLTKKCLP